MIDPRNISFDFGHSEDATRYSIYAVQHDGTVFFLGNATDVSVRLDTCYPECPKLEVIYPACNYTWKVYLRKKSQNMVRRMLAAKAILRSTLYS